jgi:alkylhydroperoxidase/carboxymuconolactone decarboxylase family protein YurZ
VHSIKKKLVAIAALTTKGDKLHLKEAFSAGRDAGLTTNEIKEILVQVYAYCRFPLPATMHLHLH